MRAGRFAYDDQFAVGGRARDVWPHLFELGRSEEGKGADGMGVFMLFVGVVGDVRVFDLCVRVDILVRRRGRVEKLC